MEKLSRILHDLDQGNINVELAKQQVLDLFSVVGQSEQLVCDCPDEKLWDIEGKIVCECGKYHERKAN
jgi:hypothetical protein